MFLCFLDCPYVTKSRSYLKVRTLTNTGAFTKVDTIELPNEQHELLRTLDVNEYDLNMRDISPDIASELSTEDIEEEDEIIHKDSNAELNQEQFEDTFTKLMEDRHAEDTATIPGAMDSNNNDKPAAAAASTGGSAASAASAASMPFPGVPQQPIEPPPVEEVPTTFPPTEELDNSGGNTGGGDAKGEGGREGEEDED